MAVALNEGLSTKFKQRAKKELNENEKHIDAHLESFRRWVDSLPHITYPTDQKSLLLPFLRHAKYSHDKAQARLDNFCTLRASDLNGAPQWFQQPPVNDPIVNTYLNSGLMLELGRTKDDVLMLLIRVGAWDVDVLPRQFMRPLSYMDLDRILADPVTQITGYGMFFDMTGLTSNHMTIIGDKRDLKMEMKIFQDGYPLRVKHLIYYNEPTIVDAMFKLTEIWLSDKIKSRILRVKNKINKAYEKVHGLKELMPAEYGGNNGTINDLIVDHARKFREFYSKPSPWRTVSVDESKRPNFAKNYMRDYADVNLDIFGTKGTYVQIDPGD